MFERINVDSHTVYIGDSASEEVVESVRWKFDVALVFADPPYNAQVDTWDNHFLWRHDYLIDIAPVVAVTPGLAHLDEFFRACRMPYKWTMSYYVSNGQSHGKVGFAKWIPVVLYSTQESLYNGMISDTPVLNEVLQINLTPKDTLKHPHRGQKPKAMIKHLIELFTKPGDIVFDPFLGSGTTLIACMETGRRCVGIDINERYVDNSIDRYYEQRKLFNNPHAKVSRFQQWNKRW